LCYYYVRFNLAFSSTNKQTILVKTAYYVPEAGVLGYRCLYFAVINGSSRF